MSVVSRPDAGHTRNGDAFDPERARELARRRTDEVLAGAYGGADL